MQQQILYEHLKGNGRDVLSAESTPLRLERTGCFLCLDGQADIRIDGTPYHLETGSLCIYYPMSLLEIEYRSENLDGLMIAVDIDAVAPIVTRVLQIDSLLDIRQNPHVRLTPEMHHVVHGYMTLYRHHQLLAERYTRLNNRRLWQLNQLQLERTKECLMLQIVIAFTADQDSSVTSLDRSDVVMHTFLKSLRLNFRQQHEVNFYASEQCLSMRYFSSLIRRQTGHTPSWWIVSALMEEARTLLKETDMSVKEIAEELNFPTQSYFGKWFKNHQGQSPLEYKRKPHPTD